MHIGRLVEVLSRSVGLALLLATSAGCGGEGGSSISVSRDSVSFTAVAGDPVPIPEGLNITYEGDGLLVGYPPGVPEATWLDVWGEPTTRNHAQLSIQPNTTALPVGTYETTLRIATGNADGSSAGWQDVHVEYHVRRGLSAEPVALVFAAVEGTAPAEEEVSLASDLATEHWTLLPSLPGGATAEWVLLPSPSGDLSGGTGRARVGMAPMPPGDYSATLTVCDGEGAIRASIPIAYHVDAVASAEPVVFDVDLNTGPTDLERTVVLRPRIAAGAGAAYHWTVAASDGWLGVTPAAGDLASEIPLTIALDPARLAAMPNGQHQASLTVTFGSGGAAPISVSVTLDLTLPEVDAVTPYAAWVGQAGAIALRGRGFGAGPTMTLLVGDQQVAARVVSDVEARAIAPAQDAPGTVQVAALNELGLPRSRGQLRVLPRPGYTPYRVEIPKLYSRMTLDAERQAVWLVGDGADGFQRMRFVDGAWTADVVSLPEGRAIALSADGQELFTVGSDIGAALTVQRRDPETLAIRVSDTLPPTDERVEYVASLADGRTLLLDRYQMNTRWYPGFQWGPSIGPWSPPLMLTRDRTLLITGDSAYDPTAYTLAAGASAFQSRRVAGFDGTAVSGDGGRIVSRASVWDRDFTRLGAIAAGTSYVSAIAVSPDGKTAYVTMRDASWKTHSFGRVDLTPSTGPYPVSPLALPASLAIDETVFDITVSDDGGTLFLVTLTGSLDSTEAHRFFHAIPLPSP